MPNGGDASRANPKVRVEDEIVWTTQRQNEPLHKFHWKLAGVIRFLNVIVLDIRYFPDISRVLTEWIA